MGREGRRKRKERDPLQKTWHGPAALRVITLLQHVRTVLVLFIIILSQQIRKHS